jgi:m7GpppX diphosphatase
MVSALILASFKSIMNNTRRVEDIFSGHSEQSKILFSSPEFIILPDMKWDLVTLSSLYLLAIARDQPLPPNGVRDEGKFRRVHSMRDLRRDDVRWLKSIRLEAGRIVKEHWGLDEKRVRCYVHYQPSYCQSHSFYFCLILHT